MNELYVSICPKTGRRFLCEAGKDNNLAEFFTMTKTARKLAARLDRFSELREALILLLADGTDEQAINDAKMILKETKA